MIQQKELEQYLLNPTMRKEVEDAIDRFEWVEQVVESCVTSEQFDGARNLYKLCESVNQHVMHISAVRDKQQAVSESLKKKQKTL